MNYVDKGKTVSSNLPYFNDLIEWLAQMLIEPYNLLSHKILNKVIKNYQSELPDIMKRFIYIQLLKSCEANKRFEEYILLNKELLKITDYR